MFLNYFILAISLSIDSLGIGITYGLRNTNILFSAKIVLFFISILMTTLSLLIGDVVTSIFPEALTSIIATFLLVFMGIWIIFQSLHTEDTGDSLRKSTLSKTLPRPTVYQFFIRFLGITIQIIRDPISSDLDDSKDIDVKESLYLGFALSIDSLCVGICSSIIGLSSFFFPLFIATFQLIFLTLGRFIGKKISGISKFPNMVWSILSGLLLILIGISRLLI